MRPLGLDLVTRGLFDYAGMFPPAALSFEDAVAESVRFSELRRPDMVAADIVVTREYMDKVAAAMGPSTRIAVVGVPIEEAVEAARQCAGLGVQVDSLEVHGEPDGQLLADAAQALTGARLFYEPKWRVDDWLDRSPWEALEAAPGTGLKVRCAGPTALDAPTLATVVHGVATRHLPFKATQGLHHPLPDRSDPARQHGFLNLTIALRLAQAGVIDAPTIQQILLDEEASFVFDSGIGWQEYRLLTQQWMELARDHPFTIGSCSLKEPDDDLSAWD